MVFGSLLQGAFLSGSVTDQGAMILVSNVLTLARILATGALGAVALRAQVAGRVSGRVRGIGRVLNPAGGPFVRRQ